MNKVFGKCLVTGGTGFIGRQLISSLVSTNHSVRLLSRSLCPEMGGIVCDLARDVIPKDALDSIETVFYLAGYTHDLQDAAKVEHLYRAVNVDATVRVAELAAENGVKRFIFVSSVKAGGVAEAGQFKTEAEQGEPEGVYGQTKREAELSILELGRHTGMHVSIVRPALVYGDGVKGNLQLMLNAILRGWFPPLPDTGNRRSMIHVNDLVSALWLVAIDGRANGEIFIATDGRHYSSREIYKTMCRRVGKRVPRWAVPKFLFDFVGLTNARAAFKIGKLLGDECYSSEKLQSIGFEAQWAFRDWISV